MRLPVVCWGFGHRGGSKLWPEDRASTPDVPYRLDPDAMRFANPSQGFASTFTPDGGVRVSSAPAVMNRAASSWTVTLRTTAWGRTEHLQPHSGTPRRGAQGDGPLPRGAVAVQVLDPADERSRGWILKEIGAGEQGEQHALHLGPRDP